MVIDADVHKCATRNLVVQLEWDEIPPGAEMPARSRPVLSPVKKVNSTPTKANLQTLEQSPISPRASFNTPRKTAGPSFNRISQIHRPVVTRPPKVMRIIGAVEIEKGAVFEDRVVTSTRFAAREGADRQVSSLRRRLLILLGRCT